MRGKFMLLIIVSMLTISLVSSARAKDIGPPAYWEQVYLPIVMKGGE